jgi:HYR domain/Secretion system C-terminal sorting domain
MKKKLYAILLLLGIGLVDGLGLQAQTVFFQDNFENATTPEIAASGVRTPENNSGTGGPPNVGYFKRTDGSDISLIGGAFTGYLNTFFWAGEDHDTPFGIGNEEQQIEWTGINISTLSGLSFRGLFGANGTNAAFDGPATGGPPSDYIIVEYAIDAGAYTQLIAFWADNIPGPTPGKSLREDTNNDQIGEGTRLTQAMQEFTKTIPTTGTTMKLRIRGFSNGLNEEWAIDNFRLLSIPPCTAPTITCPATQTLNLNASCAGTMPDYTALGVVTGNCSPVVTQSPAIGSAVSGTGAVTVTLTVTNTALQTATCNFTVNKVDVTLPAITCPANQTINTTAGLCTGVGTYTAPVGTDGCAGPTTTRTAGLASGSAFPKGPNTVTYQVTDGSANTASCSFTITVNDNQLPAITCPANQTLTAGVGVCTATATYTPPVGTDNCSGQTTARTAGLASGSLFPVGVNTVTHTVTDASANTASCSFTVTVTDNQLPAITCPANQTINTTVGLCTGVATYTAPVGTDNCSSPTTTRTVGLASGSAFPKGANTVTYQVTDGSANTASCSFTITVNDNQLPAITCPANQTVNAAVGVCTATATYTAPVGTDNCAGQSTTRTAGLASGSTFALGSNTVTFQVTDASTNTATCSFTITVADNQLPTITCPANQTLTPPVGTCAAVGTYTAPVGADNCSGPTTARTAGLASGSSFPGGPNTVTYQVTDGSGNTASCSFTMTVTDLQLPVISCPANQTVNAAVGTCGATVTYTTPVGTDNCSGPTTTRTAGLASGATFGLGATTVTYQVTDGSANTAACSFTVTVIDNQLPAITCPGNVTANTTLNLCTGIGTYTAPVGTDNCASPATIRTAGSASGSAFPIGPTTVTFQVTDGSGNTATCSFTVTVNDNQLPAITCPANQTVNATVGLCTATATYTAPVGTDNCTGTTTARTAGLASGSTFNNGPNTVTFTATDASANTASCSFSIIVADNQLPTITCPANISAPANVGVCTATVTYTAPVGADNCAGPTTTQIAGFPSGGTFPLGTTTNTFRVTDVASNSATCSFTVIVTDNQVPTINCPPNINQGTGPSSCNSAVTYALPTGSDNCSPPTIVRIAGLGSGLNYPVGVVTNTFRATDAAGNTSTCSFTVTVFDNAPPSWINCPANQSISAGPSNCTAVATWTTPSPTDNCSISSSSATYVSGSTFSTGTTTVTYTATDGGSNTGTCSFTITVSDAVPPIALCNNVTVTLDPNGNGSTTTQAVDNGSSDNCNLASVTLNQPAFTCANAPVSSVVLIATDAVGNTSSCTSIVTVITPAVTDTVYADAPLCGYNISCNGVADGVAHVAGTGGCPNFSYLWSNGNATATASGLAAGTYTVTVTDGAGGTHVSSLTLTEPPVIQVAAVVTQSCIADSNGAIDITPSGGNDCANYSFVWSNGETTEDITGLAPGTYTVTVSDFAGCTKVETVTVGIFPAPVPTFTVAAPVLTSGQVWASYQWLLNGSNISGATASTYTALQSGVYSLSVIDANGCPGISDTITVTLVGIDPAMGAWADMSIYPNPARGEFRVHAAAPIADAVTVRIHDLYGRLLATHALPELHGDVAFDITSFAAGTYFVEIAAADDSHMAGQRRLFKLVVE